MAEEIDSILASLEAISESEGAGKDGVSESAVEAAKEIENQHNVEMIDLDDLITDLEMSVADGEESIDVESVEGAATPETQEHGSPQQDDEVSGEAVASDEDDAAADDEGSGAIDLGEASFDTSGDVGEVLRKAGIGMEPPTCFGCKLPIEGAELFSTPLGWFHPEHMQCDICAEVLGEGEQYLMEETLICGACYTDMSPKCARCDGTIVDKLIEVCGRVWHPEHFLCAKCDGEFADDEFYVFEEEVLCRMCYFEADRVECAGCKEVVRGSYWEDSTGKKWHPEHYTDVTAENTEQKGELHVADVSASDWSPTIASLDVMSPEQERLSRRRSTLKSIRSHRRAHSEENFSSFEVEDDERPRFDPLQREQTGEEEHDEPYVPYSERKRDKWDSFLDDCKEGEDFTVFRRTDGAVELYWATIQKLVSVFAYEQVPDMTDVDVILSTYHRHINGMRLLQLLTQRFELIEPEGASDDLREYYAKWRVPIRMRVVNVIRRWIERYPADFRNNSTLLRAMVEFKDNVVAKDPRVGKRCTPLISSALFLAQLNPEEDISGQQKKSAIEENYESLDVLVSSMMHPKRGVPLFQRKHMFKTTRNCFYGDEAVRWLTNSLKHDIAHGSPPLSDEHSESSESTETLSAAQETGSDAEDESEGEPSPVVSGDEKRRKKHRIPKSPRREDSAEEMKRGQGLGSSQGADLAASDLDCSDPPLSARSGKKSPLATPSTSGDEGEAGPPSLKSSMTKSAIKGSLRVKDKKKRRKMQLDTIGESDEEVEGRSKAFEILSELLEKKIVSELAITSSRSGTFKPSSIYYFSDAMDSRSRTLLDFSPSDIARYLTAREHSRFQQVTIEDFENKVAGKKSVALTTFADRTTKLSQWVGTELCRASTNSKRSSLMQRWIQVADEFMKLRNFESALGVVSGLKSVKMMKDAWKGVKAKYIELYHSIRGVFSTENNYSLIRQRQRDAESPFIPYIALIIQDLTFIEDGNKEYDDRGRVNVKKMRLLHTIFGEIMRAQSVSFPDASLVPMIRYYATERILDTMNEKEIMREARKKLDD